MDLTLETPVRYVARVGPISAKKLEKLGIRTIEDLLFYPPFRYNDYSLISPIGKLQPGEVVTVQGYVENIRNIFTKRGKKIQEALITDESGSIPVVWFNQPFLIRVITHGAHIRLAGTVNWFSKQVALVSPDYELIQENINGQAHTDVSLHTGRLVPVYPETAGITSKWLRGRIAYVLDQCISQVQELLPSQLKETYRLMELTQALRQIHFPESQSNAIDARRRLGFDELFMIHLIAQFQRQAREQSQADSVTISSRDLSTFLTRLEFTLTGDQKQAVHEILHDISRNFPANRLLVGDVGSGKTVVAAIAMYAVFRNGRGSILMAPTQLLAQQHFETISKLLTPLGIKIGLFTGAQKNNEHTTKNNQRRLNVLKNPQFDIYIGTHALLSDSRTLKHIGLIVIDEQQRFGVEQRLLLRKKSEGTKTPHLLTMTATPIPRTIALTMFGNLDLSILNEMPKGRIRIKTWVVPNDKRDSAYEWIKKHLVSMQGQMFVICPLIEESETLSTVRAATKEFDRLKRTSFKNFRLGLLHGRMKPKEKTNALEAFRLGNLDILVTTPVVEVGIDIPNATIMLIEGSDRFGLSALHQLRGRVGRGNKQSYCLLFTENDDEKVLSRLKHLETIFSGPELADVDLRLRGPGELFGTRQHGIPQLTFATFSDTQLIHDTANACKSIIARDPSLSSYPLLRERLKKSTIEQTSQD